MGNGRRTGWVFGWLLLTTAAGIADPNPINAVVAPTASDALRQGVAAYRRHDYDLAIACDTEAIRINPQFSPAYSDRGAIYAAKGDIAAALADYAKAVELDPRDANAYSNRGVLHKEHGDLDLAIADYDRAIEINPKNGSYYSNRANVYLAKDDYARTMTDLDQALQLNPQDAAAYNIRGKVHLAQGRLDPAVADFSEAIRINPRFPLPYVNRAKAYHALGKNDLAQGDYDTALRLNPSDADALVGRQALASTPAQSSLPFKLGDDLPTVQAALHTSEAPTPFASIVPGSSQLRLMEKGIVVSFNSLNRIYQIKLTPPFGGPILGVHIGDTVEAVTARLGAPAAPPAPIHDERYPGWHSYVYRLDETSRVSFHIDHSGLVQEIHFSTIGPSRAPITSTNHAPGAMMNVTVGEPGTTSATLDGKPITNPGNVAPSDLPANGGKPHQMILAPPTQGEFAEIDTKPTASVMQQLEKTAGHENDALVQQIEKDAGNYTPPVLFELAALLYRQGNLDDAIFWFNAARLRTVYDAMRSTDKSAGGALDMLVAKLIPNDLRKAQFNDCDQFRRILDRVIQWDEATPSHYDCRWIALYGLRAIQNSLGNTPDTGPLTVPRETWEVLAKQSRDEYRKGVSKAIASVEEIRKKQSAGGSAQGAPVSK